MRWFLNLSSQWTMCSWKSRFQAGTQASEEPKCYSANRYEESFNILEGDPEEEVRRHCSGGTVCGGGAEEGDGNRLPVLEQLKRKFDKRKDRTLTYLLRFSLSLLHSPLSISPLIQSMLTFVSGNPGWELESASDKTHGNGISIQRKKAPW